MSLCLYISECYGCCPFLVVDTSRGGGRVWPNFRRVCFSIVQHKYFEIFIIFIILLSSATLMFEDTHLQQQQLLKEVLERADQVFVLIFLMEMLLKWVAFGFKKYFTDAWCCLDFLILHVFLVSLAADTFGFISFGAFQFLRTFRALGPLRVLSHFQVLRVVVQSLLRSARPLLDVLLVCLLVWCFFSILGVNLFAGKFSGCYNETSEQFFSTEDVNNKTECLILIYDGNYTEVRWKKMLNYDNVASGYLSLLHLGASADSMGIMYSAVDATLIESQPIYEANTYMYLYFVCFMISSFFTYNFLIRVIIDNLQRDKSTGKCIFTTEQQQKYFEAFKKRVMKPEKAVPRPQNWLQARLFDLVTSLYFKVFIVVVICLFMVTMMVSTDEQSEEMDTILQWIHFVCILIFLIELILKVVALRKLYFTDSWNILDFSVLAVSIVGLIIHEVLVKYVYFFPIFSPILFLMLRAVHIFRMLFWSRGIRKLLLGFIMSLPALFNIGLLLFIVMFIFSVFGMFNFAYVQKKGLIDDMFNFETFVNSMICLLMISSTASWDNLLRPIMDTPPDCDPYIQIPGSMIRGDCGSPVLAIIFFVTHIFLCLLLVFNMYIAVILETFNSEDTETLSDHDLQEFYKTWRKFDPESSQFIQYSELSDFCDALQDPLRIPKPNSIKLIHMDLPLQPRDKIHSVDVLLALAAQVLGDSGKRNSLKVRLEEKFTDKPAKCGPISSTLQRKREEVAATVIQRAFRKHILQHGDVGATLQ